MKCAPVRIRSGDEMPNFICQKCHTRLEKTYQFQTQIIQSEKTLQRYLEQLHVFDKKSKLKNSIQNTTEHSLIENANADITKKCESLELHDVVDLNVNYREKEYENSNSASKINIEMSLKSEMKDEQDNSINSPDCADHSDSKFMEGMNFNRKVEETAKFTSACDSIEKIFLKSEIKDEPTNDGSLILMEFTDDTNGVSEISCEDTNVGFDHMSGNSAYLRSSDLGENFVKFKEKIINTSSKINKEMPLKSEMKDKQDNSIISSNCANDSVETFSKDVEESFISIGDSKLIEEMDGKWKEEKAAKKGIEKMSLKSEIKDEPMDDGSLILAEFTDDTVNDFSNGVSEISYEHTKVGFDLVSENPANFLSSEVGEYFEKFEERIKNASMDREAHIKNSKVKSHQFKIKDTCKKHYIKTRFFETSTSKKLNQCDICKKCFTEKYNLNAHKLIHTGEKPYQCDICKKCFTAKYNLNAHKLTHTGEKPYQCDICEKCFTNSRNLNCHKLIHTGEKPCQCDICKKCFTRQCDLNKHKLTHTGEKPFQCGICQKCFTQLSHLKTHKLQHTGEKQYQCDICEKYFTRSTSLNTHKLIHTGKKPYQCDICLKCFTRQNTLNKHKLTHTGEKPFRCDICDKCFTQSGTLITHKLIHSGEKPYQCDICKKYFTQSSHLNRHKLQHTGDKPYQCDICKKCFNHLCNLNTHKLTHTDYLGHKTCEI